MRTNFDLSNIRCAICLLLTFLAGCGTARPPLAHTDAEVSQKLVGKWNEESTAEGITTIMTHEFTQDGKYACSGKMRRPGGESDLAMSGTWQVTGGVLVYTLQTSQPAYYKPGEQVKDQVLSIDDQEFIYKDEDGEESTMTRLKQ
jgi:uncharacterized protein (TIGR03066 family)